MNAKEKLVFIQECYGYIDKYWPSNKTKFCTIILELLI